MKRSPVVLLALLALVVVGVTGCSTMRQNKQTATARPRSFALAVTVHGTLQPTPQQWSVIQAKLAKVLAARGWVLVTDVSLADHILRVDFTPNPDNPESSGLAKVIGVRNNPLSTVARQGTSPYPSSSLGYANAFSSGWWGSSYYSGNYTGWGDLYYNGYGSDSYTPVVFTPNQPTPSHHHRPGNRDDCPPPIPMIQSGFASNLTGPVYDHPRPPPSDHGRGSGEHGYARSSSSDRSYSRDSYSRSDSFPSSSYSSSYDSSSSYSPPTSSYSADTSSSSSAVAASISSSAPAVGTVSSAH